MKSFESGGVENDLEHVRHISVLVKKKLLGSNPNYEKKLEKLTKEELEDLDKILGITEQILLKYQHKKEAYVLLKEFLDLLKSWSMPLSEINDHIQIMLISAQSSISEIKNAQNEVSTNFSIDSAKKQMQITVPKQGTINLTKSTTAVYPQEYQQNNQIQFEQVV
jgi:plasmid rolling circle replication initiator protein Rep